MIIIDYTYLIVFALKLHMLTSVSPPVSLFLIYSCFCVVSIVQATSFNERNAFLAVPAPESSK